MAFVDELYSRYGTQNVIRLSQLDSTVTGFVDTTVIASVLADVEGVFRTYGGVLYDATDSRMLGLAADLGILFLRKRNGEHDVFTAQWQDILARLFAIRKVTHSDTVLADTTLVNEIPLQRSERSAFDSNVLKLSGFPSHATPGVDYSGGYID